MFLILDCLGHSAKAVLLMGLLVLQYSVCPDNMGRAEDHLLLESELAQPKRYSKDMAWLFDQERHRLMLEAGFTAAEIISGNRPALINLAERLIEDETLDKEAVDRIIEELRLSSAGLPLSNP